VEEGRLETATTLAAFAAFVVSTGPTPIVGEKSKITPRFLKHRSIRTSDRLVVSPTKFNKRDFAGFVTLEDADKMRNAIGLSNEQHHGTSFRRNKINGMLYILFILKKEKSHAKIDQKNFNKDFWICKESTAGNVNTISGLVVYPRLANPTNHMQQ
jgi:hypothetical protein